MAGVAMAVMSVAVAGFGMGVPVLRVVVSAWVGGAGRMGMRGHLAHCTQEGQGAQPEDSRLLGSMTTGCAEAIDGVYRHCHHEASYSRAHLRRAIPDKK